jgi:hypothetical protein
VNGYFYVNKIDLKYSYIMNIKRPDTEMPVFIAECLVMAGSFTVIFAILLCCVKNDTYKDEEKRMRRRLRRRREGGLVRGTSKK